MDKVSSTINEDKTINRSDPSRMYNIGHTPLAQSRPEKLDDVELKKRILKIQEECGDIDPDLIAIVFHECDYNMQTTITRIKTGDFEDSGWQTAKSNNKKKNHTNNLGDQILNGSTQSDSERSHSQRTSPTSSLRGSATAGRRRPDHYQYSSSSRTNTTRRGNDSNRNPYIPSNSRYPSRNYSNNNKPISNQVNPSEIISSSKQTDEITPTTTSSSTDEYEFIGGTSQSLTFDNSLKKDSLISFTKHRIPSSIPQQPVLMHSTIQFSTKPIDIQFGDLQWNDSIPITITPSNSPILIKSLDEQQSSSALINDHQQQIDVQDNLSSNFINHHTTNDIESELYETTHRLSSSSITNNPIANNSTEEISHLSDQLTDSSQQQQQRQMPSSLPPTSTPNTSEYTSPTSQLTNPFISNTLINTTNPPGSNSSAFTPYTTPSGPFQSIPRDFSQSTTNWNQQQSTNYKTNTKPTMIQTGTYSQQPSYQLPPQQQFFVGTYPYHTPTLYPLITPVDPWSTAGFEPYSTYPTTNYLPTYPTQQQYHPNTKHDQYLYDKEFFAHYGQTRLTNNEITNSSQTTKDVPTTSKLSATAASFSQATSPATTFYPILYTVPAYYTSHQDRTMTYPSVDNRDNRNGASYGGGGNNNRNHYHHQQQRTHNNSSWHS